MKKISPIKLLIIFLALVFVVHQLISVLYKPISTENAYFYTANNGLDITGVIIRNEKLVTSDKGGVLHFMIPDGNRVSKDGTIANIYTNEEASITLNKINIVKEKISDIEDILSQNNVEAANFDVANTNVDNKLNELILSSAYGDFSLVDHYCGQLLNALNKRQAVLGDTNAFSNELSSLNNELSSLNKELSTLESSLSDPIGQIKSTQSGYFISKTDGYENSFPIDDLTKITPDFLSKLKKKKQPSNVIGKIVSDYEWYIAATVPINDSMNFKVDDDLIIHTSTNASPDFGAKVKNINLSADGTNAVIIFSCSDMNSELATMRTGAMTVIKEEYSGLRIPEKALRVVDSVKGVYVVSGMQIKFTPVDIVFTGKDFVLCKKDEKDNSLRLYDQVVVRGKNLYDGKIIS